jgi:hypothetical protein
MNHLFKLWRVENRIFHSFSAELVRHNAAIRIVFAIGAFTPETGGEVSLPPGVSEVHVKPVPDAGTGFVDFASA